MHYYYHNYRHYFYYFFYELFLLNCKQWVFTSIYYFIFLTKSGAIYFFRRSISCVKFLRLTLQLLASFIVNLRIQCEKLWCYHIFSISFNIMLKWQFSNSVICDAQVFSLKKPSSITKNKIILTKCLICFFILVSMNDIFKDAF